MKLQYRRAKMYYLLKNVYYKKIFLLFEQCLLNNYNIYGIILGIAYYFQRIIKIIRAMKKVKANEFF